MEYKVLMSRNLDVFNQMINDYIKDGWEPLGSHQVIVSMSENNFRGDFNIGSVNEVEYSQTMVKKKTRTPLGPM
jgi:hypothetical protein